MLPLKTVCLTLWLVTSPVLLSLIPPLRPFIDQVIAQEEPPPTQHQDGNAYFNMGVEQYQSGQIEASALSFQAALEQYRVNGVSAQQAIALRILVLIYAELERAEAILTIAEDALALNQTYASTTDYLTILNFVASAFMTSGQYTQAIDYYEQGVAIAPPEQKVHLLLGLCAVYGELAEGPAAIEFGQQALLLAETQNNGALQVASLTCIGIAHNSVSQYDQAITVLQNAAALANTHNFTYGKYLALLNLGWTYQSAEKYEAAIASFEQTLPIAQKIDPLSEAWVIGNLGHSYGFVGRYQEGLELLFQALSVAEEAGTRYGQWSALRSIAIILEQQQRPELAIIFYKQSINVIEDLRGNIASLPPEIQQSYTDSVAGIYRRLANLLIQQNRILEAQQVLDLLQVEELNEYLHDVRGNEITAQGLDFWQAEQEILSRFNAQQSSAIALGQELRELRQIPQGNRTPTQQARIDTLVELELSLNQQFNAFLDSDEISELLIQLITTTDRQAFDPVALQSLRDELQDLDSILFYPLILDDRLELIITTPDSPPLRRTVEVSRAELNATILDLRQALEDPTSDATTSAHQLYQWLLAPLESDLASSESQSIIYAPDGQLRYIPLTALYDGEQWIAERYTVNNITARSLTDWQRPPVSSPRVLAGAFADTTISYSVDIGDRSLEFQGLPFAGVEVQSLATAIPGSTLVIDQDFSLSALQSQLNEHDIVHFATHAAFVPERAGESFILFGNGDRSTLADVRNWSLQNVDLVVLSACETGLGGFGNGAEILGLGYQFQRAGARAAIASLWQVSDGGTQVLMDAFYAALQTGHTKTEALQRAQQVLITGDYSGLGLDERGAVAIRQRIQETVPQSVSQKLSHPYYWAPFILIGNGL